jgi:hypothetical protein
MLPNHRGVKMTFDTSNACYFVQRTQENIQ